MSLKQKTIRGLSWVGVTRVGTQASQFVITAILAHLLSPSDFGLVGMSTVFTGLALLFIDMGLSNALIQRQDATDEHRDSAFWLNILIGLALMLVMLAVSGRVAAFLDMEALAPILRALSVIFVISSLGLVQRAILRRNLDFKKIGSVEMASAVSAGLFGIALALSGFGAWSLAGQAIASATVTVVLLWWGCSWRPTLRCSLPAARDLLGFGLNLTGFNLVNFFNRHFDVFMIGKALGPEPLGYYAIAKKLILLPVQHVSGAIGSVMLPVLSEIQEDLERTRRAYSKLVNGASLLAFPAMAGLYLTAPQFVELVYGSQWHDVVELVQILAFCGMAQSIATSVGLVYQSQGRPDISFKFASLVSMPTTVLAVAIGLNHGIDGVALAHTVRMFVIAIVSLQIALALISLSWRELLRAISTGTFLALGVTGAVLLARTALDTASMATWLSFTLEAGAGALAFAVLMLGLDVHEVRTRLSSWMSSR